jgi:hypothetical protein
MHVIYLSMRMFLRSSVSWKVGLRSGMLKYGIRAMFSTLSLDGMDKWSLDPRFRVEMVF